jgi:hypothetical protein
MESLTRAVNAQQNTRDLHLGVEDKAHRDATMDQETTSLGSMGNSAASSSPRSARSTSFFNFPREIRNQIYDELWQMTPIINIHFHGYNLYIARGKMPLPYQDEDKAAYRKQQLPTWLLSSKQMLDEGLVEHRFPGISLLWDRRWDVFSEGLHMNFRKQHEGNLQSFLEWEQPLLCAGIATAENIIIDNEAELTEDHLYLSEMAQSFRDDDERSSDHIHLLTSILEVNPNRLRNVRILFSVVEDGVLTRSLLRVPQTWCETYWSDIVTYLQPLNVNSLHFEFRHPIWWILNRSQPSCNMRSEMIHTAVFAEMRSLRRLFTGEEPESQNTWVRRSYNGRWDGGYETYVPEYVSEHPYPGPKLRYDIL